MDLGEFMAMPIESIVLAPTTRAANTCLTLNRSNENTELYIACAELFSLLRNCSGIDQWSEQDSCYNNRTLFAILGHVVTGPKNLLKILVELLNAPTGGGKLASAHPEAKAVILIMFEYSMSLSQ